MKQSECAPISDPMMTEKVKDFYKMNLTDKQREAVDLSANQDNAEL